MIPQIPKYLLSSVMRVREPVDSKFGGEYAETPKVVQGVRYEQVSALAEHGGYVLTNGSAGVVYVDACNSGGAYRVPEGSLVSIDGADWLSVRKVVEHSIGKTVHHWEIEVM